MENESMSDLAKNTVKSDAPILSMDDLQVMLSMVEHEMYISDFLKKLMPTMRVIPNLAIVTTLGEKLERIIQKRLEIEKLKKNE
jgi:hypothetical protein